MRAGVRPTARSPAPIDLSPKRPVVSLPFELHQLQCFVTLSQTRHFGKAAEQLHMTQPPLSRQISLLEARMGVRLFERNSRFVELTAAGEYLLREAVQILERANEVAVEARLAAQGEQGTVSIGFTATASYEVLPRLIGQHHRLYPGVNFVLKELLVSEQLERLAADALDVAIVRPPFDAGRFNSHVVMVDRWAVAMPEGHALGRHASVTLPMLQDQALIAWSPVARVFHLRIERIFEDAGIRPQVVLSMAQPTGILAMVRARLGVSIVPFAMGAQGLRGVVLKPLELPVDHTLESVMIWRKDRQDAALARFVQTAQSLDTFHPPTGY
jgi:DNA-binding transcriptional LysR family regulator